MIARYEDFQRMGDDAGWLIALETGKNIPFDMRRAYYIYGTADGVTRGKHAHHKLRQLMVCMAGSCTVLLDDGHTREEVRLTTNERGLYIDPMVWHEMHTFSRDCVLLVLADDLYKLDDYIRDYTAFKALPVKSAIQ